MKRTGRQWRTCQSWFSLSEAVHTKTLFCENASFATFWPTVHTDPENATPDNGLFWKRVSGWKNPKTQPLFSCGQRIRILSETMMPWPHPSTSSLDLWTPRLLITTTTMVDYMLVFCHRRYWAFLATNSPCECESQQQFDLINGPHKWFWFPCTSHFHLLLLVFSFSFYCLSVYSAQALCATYRPGIWST